jgi:hypothetical protein
MPAIRILITPLHVVIPLLLLGSAGCFTEVRHTTSTDAPSQSGEAAAPSPDTLIQEVGPAAIDAPVAAPIDGSTDVPLSSTGGTSGFDGASEAFGAGGGGGSSGAGGIIATGGSTGTGGILGSGGSGGSGTGGIIRTGGSTGTGGTTGTGVSTSTGGPTTCTLQTDCGSTSYCKITSGTTGICVAKNPNGTSAVQPFECVSGIVADGVCCDKACTGCSACSGAPLTAATAGQCAYVVAGQVAHGACTASSKVCGPDGTCDGNGSCRSTPQEGQACSEDPNNKCVSGGVCRSGACSGAVSITCTSPPECQTGGTCLTSTGQCSYSNIPDNTNCTGDGNACYNHACQSGACVATLKPCNSPTPCHVSPGTCSGGTCSYPTPASNGSVDYTCPSGKQFCYGGQCVQCTSDVQCSSVRPSCDSSSHACVCKKPSAGNLLKNPGFDGSMANWTSGAQVSYSTIDSDGCSESGSFYVNGSTDGDPSQCFPVTPGVLYYVGLRSRAGNPGGQIRFNFWGGVNCTGSIVDTLSPISFSAPSDNTTWFSYDGYSFTAPGSAVSATLAVYAWNQWLDQLYVNPDGQRF